MKKTNVDVSKTEVTPFELKLPAVLDVKPDHIVQLPRNVSALIYISMVDHNVRTGEPVSSPITHYSVYYVSSKTGVSKAIDRYRGCGPVSYTDLPRLKQELVDAAAVLSVKKRVQQSTETVEDDE